MKRILLLILLSGCAGQIKELKETDKTQYEMLGRFHNRIKALEAEQNDTWVEQTKLELAIQDLREELKRVEYIISKEDETKCPK